ncbi:YgjP-like metallopeptidase domain-containing protein [Neptunicella sp.]|uniref:YgjP-like metallopeptidase domain-containing protein n=1 Tax=Neptunicella sp. TaxID=2125986 RepID=UPI003F6907C0
MSSLTYLSAYSPELQQQISRLLAQNKLGEYLRNKYPDTHNIANDNDLREYVLTLKNRYMKNAAPLSKVLFDKKIHVINNALGLHTYATRIQGNKLKSKNEMRISDLFKRTPEAFLNMIVVHELAHFKQKQHNKAFYQLCTHMLADYHQLEFDLRVYLTELAHHGDVYQK